MSGQPRPCIQAIAPVTLTRPNRLANMYVLSPFVWRASTQFHLMLRCVPRRDDDPRLKMAEIWHGVSDDGLHFVMDEAPVVFPGPDLADLDGCEDRTVVQQGGLLHLWYTGYNELERIGRLIYARGPDARRLAKVGVAIESTPPHFANPKEASVVPIGDRWRLFFEFARDGASLIGHVDADRLDGPWSDPVVSPIAPRPDSWDNWHLSPGPIIGAGTDHPVMIYNGADRTARWRIGWAAFNPDFSSIVARAEAPLLSPELERFGQDSDIAFASSAIESDDGVAIYFSESDQQLRRALMTFD